MWLNNSKFSNKKRKSIPAFPFFVFQMSKSDSKHNPLDIFRNTIFSLIQIGVIGIFDTPRKSFILSTFDKTTFMIRILRFLYFCLFFVFLGKVNAQDFIPTFGVNGKLTIDFKDPYKSITASTTTADGKILIGGSISDPTNSRKIQTYVARLLSNGQIDETFGTKGYAYLSLGNDIEGVKKIVSLSNGKIMVGEEGYSIAVDYSLEWPIMAVLRLNENGTLDKTYNQGGWISYGGYFGDFDVYPDGSLLLIPYQLNTTIQIYIYEVTANGRSATKYLSDLYTTEKIRPTSLKILPDGNAVVAGYFSSAYSLKNYNAFIAKISAQGNRDVTFGTDGITEIETSSGFNVGDVEVHVKDGGGFVLAATKSNLSSIVLAQLNKDGSIIQEFNNGKSKLLELNDTNFIATDIKFDSQANILVGGIIEDSEKEYQFGARKILANGHFDQGFGILGYAEVETQLLRHRAPIIGILSNQEILLMGSELGLNTSNISIGRYQSDGKIDRSFGINGSVTIAPVAGINLYSDEVLQDIIQSKDGKLVAAGFLNTSMGNGIIVTKIDVTGKPDLSFAKDGVAIIHSARMSQYYLYDYIELPSIELNLIEDKDGSLFILAFGALYKLTPNGELDLTFGINGKANITVSGKGNGLVIQPDGKIVVAIFTDVQCLVRFETNGELDLSFGKDGIVAEPLLSKDTSNGRFKIGKQLAVFPDGKLIVIGVSKPSDYLPTGYFSTFKYNADGTPDLSFGYNGRVSTQMHPDKDGGKPQSVLIQPDSKILVAGTANSGICLMRLFSDGRFDTDFGFLGKITGIGLGRGGINGMALQSDGKILLTGGAYSEDYAAHYLDKSWINITRTYPNGHSDSSFGYDGTMSLDNISSGSRNLDAPSGLLVTNIGKIYICGATDVVWRNMGRGRTTEQNSLIIGLNYNADDYNTPKITSFSPKVATSQRSIIIVGNNFFNVQSVTFGGQPAKSFNVIGPGKIEAVIDNGATGKITVTTSTGIAEIDGFIYIENPILNYTNEVHILRGSPLQLKTQAQSGVTYQWYKDNDAIAGANTFYYDVTETGTYRVVISLNQVEFYSNQVKVNIKFHLSSDNFTIATKSVACNGQQNGEIIINAKENLSYKVKVKGNNYNKEFAMNTAITINGLAAGSYNICISPENITNFEQCFDVIITEPKKLSVYSSSNTTQGTITLELSGAENYHVLFNNQKYETASSSITLPLVAGANTISISTDLNCQGLFNKTIFYKSANAYPNPFTNHFGIATQKEWGDKLVVQLMNASGSKVYDAIHENVNDEISVRNLEKLPTGMYILTIKSPLINKTYKLVKP